MHEKTALFLGSLVREQPWFPRFNPTGGHLFGVELEMEGSANITHPERLDDVSQYWHYHMDGSLRNYAGGACEWVTREPAPFPRVRERIEVLFRGIELFKVQLVQSSRTSMHVHYNAHDKAIYQIVNLFIVFTMFEELLGKFCGQSRESNLFCLPARESVAQVEWLEEACFAGNFRLYFPEQNRYAALNLAALSKLGTVEFRGMRGVDNAKDAIDWLSIVHELCRSAMNLTNPAHILRDVSLLSPAEYLKVVFPKTHELVRGNLSDEQVNDSVYEGLRLVQPLVYRLAGLFGSVRLRPQDRWPKF